MSKVKKVLAIILSMAMVLGMSLTAFAATKDSATITFNELGEADKLEYVQIIEPDTSTSSGWNFCSEEIALAYAKGFLANDDLTTVSELQKQQIIWSLILSVKGDANVPTEVGSVVPATADKIDAALSKVAAEITFTELADKSSLIVNEAGIYVFKAEEEGYTYKPMAAYVGFGEVEGYDYPSLVDTSVTAKKSSTTIEKTVSDTDHAVAIGDIVTYTVEAYVPYIDANDTNKTFTITDILEGAEYYLAGDGSQATITVDGYNDVITFPTPTTTQEGKQTFTVDLSGLIDAQNTYAGKLVTITYTAKITEVDANNQALGHIGDDETSSQPTVDIYTGTITLTKYGETNSELLAGAGFEVTKGADTTPLKFTQDVDDNNEPIPGQYTYDPEGNVTEVFTNADGQVVVKGLDVGTYKFTEKTAPEGYSVNTTPAEATLKVEGTATAIFTDETSMNDTKLSSLPLPSTGGMGTTIFTIGGCVIMIAAAGLYFASRRKENK